MFFRTVVLYSSVLFMMRLMGKREVGQLSLFDLVVAIMIAELAAIPMEDTSKPLINGLLPIATLVLMEITLSFITLKSRRAQAIIEGTPSIIVERGRIIEAEMRRLRYAVDDLISQLRQQGIHNLEDVEYAILETNGKLSVILKSDRRPVTPRDIGLNPGYEGLPMPLVVDGELQTENLARADKTVQWLEQGLIKEANCTINETIYAVLDTNGKLYVYKKGETKKTPTGVEKN